MTTRTDEQDKSADTAVEPGYLAWKRAKIERGVEQCKDRAAMIPIEQVWPALDLEH